MTEEEMRYMIRMADADAGGEIGEFTCVDGSTLYSLSGTYVFNHII